MSFDHGLVALAITDLLDAIGEDPNRPGLAGTPDRVAAAWREMLAGYDDDPATILAVDFDDVAGYDGPVEVAGIPFVSLCEHHLMPFSGTVSIVYSPCKRVLGLSKVARLVACFARRLQVQERLTAQIADALVASRAVAACSVAVEASHACMQHRGAKSAGTVRTVATRGTP